MTRSQLPTTFSRVLRPALLAGLALVAGPGTIPLLAEEGVDREDLRQHPECSYCGMDRTRFSHTRHLVVYPAGKSEGTCSIRCAATSLVTHSDLPPLRVLAADAGNPDTPEPLLPVSRLTYVIDPGVPGTMTGTRKWAYSSKVVAHASIAPSGRTTDFAGALESALAEIGRDLGESLARRARPGRSR